MTCCEHDSHEAEAVEVRPTPRRGIDNRPASFFLKISAGCYNSFNA